MRNTSGIEKAGRQSSPKVTVFPEATRVAGLITLLSLMLFGVWPAAAQGEGDRAMELIRAAIDAMGGETHANVKDLTFEGRYFLFDRQGRSSGLIKFLDYNKLPDKSRNELGNHEKTKEITVFNLEANQGWILEGQKETRDATPGEIKGFTRLIKHSIENIFRSRYRNPKNMLFYLGPGEGKDVRLERVKLLDAENDETVIFFDRLNRLPVKIEYHYIDSQGVRLRNVDEFYQWHVIDGVKMPLRTDSYVNGRRAAQLFVTKVTLNSRLADTFFSKPMPPK